MANEFGKAGHEAEDGEGIWVETDRLRPELYWPVLAMKPGEVSDVISVDSAFYVLKLEERRRAALGTFEKAQLGVQRELKRMIVATQYDAWIERLRKDAHIVILDVRAKP